MVCVWALYGIGQAAQSGLPPTITSSSPTEQKATPGDLLDLSVVATDSSGGPLTFKWKANTGTLGFQQDAKNTSTVQWTALSCVPAGVNPTIEVTITNPSGLSVRRHFTVMWNGPACGHPPCDLQLGFNLLTLQKDCMTDVPVFIPGGFTLDGAGKSLVAVDPAGGTFTGAILRNRDWSMNVDRLTVKAQGLKGGACHGGDDRLVGILLRNASGSVTNSEVLDIRWSQPGAGSPESSLRGCQEGFAIMVRIEDGTARNVELKGNEISGYQKAGIVVSGPVNTTVINNKVQGSGPVEDIAQNGIQFSNGATGKLTSNTISSHSYAKHCKPDDQGCVPEVASAILVLTASSQGSSGSGRDTYLSSNTLTNNDVGIYLQKPEPDNSGSDGEARMNTLKVYENTLQNDAVTNGIPYQVGILDTSGNGNIIYSNTVAGAGYNPATRPNATYDVQVFGVGATSQVAFLQAPFAAVGRSGKGFCSSEAIVQSQDVNGNLSMPTSRTFKLEASGRGGASEITFHEEPDCKGREIKTVELTRPEATASFYVKGRGWGTVTLSVSNGSMEGSADMQINVTAGGAR